MRHPRLVQMGLALAAAATAACSVSSSSFTPQDEAAIRAINDSASAYIRAGAWEKWAALYADDAVLQPPNARPVVGRAAIEHFGRSMPPSESAEMFGVRSKAREILLT